MKYRMAAAVLSLLGVLLAAYLYLYKIGAIPGLVCGTGGCETVQASPYARFLGVEVALIGVAGYAACLALALVGVGTGAERRHWSDRLLLVATTLGVGFTAWLTYAEAALIHAWCRWCLGSAAIITLLCATAWLGWRALGRATTAA
ncbi:MAG TPA: vitamin K epoxide reductase family protein [Gemmatimonadales bacterium]|nr:vitamin K epoxide reductase family protein [Gemmatimonadales bacterium]